MRIGMTGTNFVSDFFMAAAREVPEIQVTAVTSGHRAHADAFAVKYGIPAVYDSLADMLEKAELDAVYLPVPNLLHHDMTITCLQRHLAVITEKPFAVTPQQAAEMFAISAQENAYVHDAIVPLYTDHFQQLKQELGRVGRIRRAVISFSKYSSRYDAYLRGENPPTFRPELCNGSWMDLGIYCVADAVGLFGKPLAVQASAVRLDSGADCQGAAILHYDGFDAVLLHSKVTDTGILSEIEGEEGTLTFDVPSLISHIWYTKRPHAGEKAEKILLSAEGGNPFACQLRDFVRSRAEGRPESALVPHRLSLDILETLTQCRTQAGVVFPADAQEGKEHA